MEAHGSNELVGAKRSPVSPMHPGGESPPHESDKTNGMRLVDKPGADVTVCDELNHSRELGIIPGKL